MIEYGDENLFTFDQLLKSPIVEAVEAVALRAIRKRVAEAVDLKKKKKRITRFPFNLLFDA